MPSAYPTPDDRPKPAVMAPGRRRGIFAEIRATRRDPLYRHECRQAAQWKAWAGLAASVALFFVISCLGLLALMILPGVLVTEGLLYEMDGNTLQGLMLTPVERNRVLWAKLAARLRPMVWVTVVLPVAGAGIGFTQEFLAIGLGIGVLAALLWMGQCLTSGAFGVLAALQARQRVTSYLLVLLYTFVQYVAEWIVMLLVMAAVVLGGRLFFKSSEADLLLIIGLGIGVLVLAARVLLVNILLPTWILRYAARNMDRMLLHGS